MQGALSGLASKGIVLLVNAISIPITIRYLGAERFGIWITISTALSMLLVLDLGVANSLTNFTSQAYANDDPDHASTYSTTALAIMVVFATLLGAVAWVIWPHLQWDRLFHLASPNEAATVSKAVAAALAIFLVGLPAGLAPKILGGYQELRTANIFTATGSLVNLVSVVVLVRLHAGLVALVAASSAALVGANLLCLIWLWSVHKPWLAPRRRHLSRPAARRMMQTGTEFFLLQIAGLVVFNSDNLVVTHYLGPSQVASYSVAWRLVGYAAVLQTMITPALWPAFSESFARGDLAWVRHAFRRTLWLTMGTALAFSALFAVAGRTLIRLWASNAAVPTQTLMLLMCAWVLISTFMNNTATVLVAIGETRLQAWCSVAAAIFNLASQSIGCNASELKASFSPRLRPTWSSSSALKPGKSTEFLLQGGRPARSGASHMMALTALKRAARIGLSPEALLARAAILRTFRILPKARIGSPSAIQSIFFSFPYHSVGDVILSLTLLERLPTLWPEATVDVAVGTTTAALVAALPFVRHVFPIPRPSSRQLLFAAYADLHNQTSIFQRQIAAHSYDLAIAPRWDSADSYFSAYLAYLTGAPIRCGYVGDGGSCSTHIDRLYTHAATGGAHDHESLRYSQLLVRCGLETLGEVDLETPRKPLRALVDVAAQRRNSGLALPSPTSANYCVFSPGATNPRRMWPLDRFAEVGRHLFQQHGLSTTIIGAPGDHVLCERLRQAIGPGANSMAGKTDALQMLDLIATATLFVGNDSGPAHIASVLGVRTFVVSPSLFPATSSTSTRRSASTL